MLSIVTPAFNEAANLPELYDRLARTMGSADEDWEWIVVDDHSRDATFAVIEEIAARDPRVRGIRLAHNAGSHVAITCGLHHAAGTAAAMMAADLQDPPETLTVMLERWRRGAQIVWAVRRQRPGERAHAGFAALYYWVMRRVIGMTDMPARGADFFLVDRIVVNALKEYPERNRSVLALITSLGFRQEYVEYDKQPRLAGSSGWTLGRNVTLVVDSITSFSALPLRLCTFLGIAFATIGATLGVVGVGFLPSLGAGLLLVFAAMIGLSGIQLIGLGIMGEYLWRALDEARRRPPYLIEAVVGEAGNPTKVR
jgi:polyisoprenyl-phosphate glycosyltransferase